MRVPLHIINNSQYTWRTVFVNDIEHITLDDLTQRNLFWLEIWAFAITQKHNIVPVLNQINEHDPVYINSTTGELLDDAITAFSTIYALPPTIIKLNNVVVVIVYVIVMVLLLFVFHYQKRFSLLVY